MEDKPNSWQAINHAFQYKSINKETHKFPATGNPRFTCQRSQSGTIKIADFYWIKGADLSSPEYCETEHSRTLFCQ